MGGNILQSIFAMYNFLLKICIVYVSDILFLCMIPLMICPAGKDDFNQCYLISRLDRSVIEKIASLDVLDYCFHIEQPFSTILALKYRRHFFSWNHRLFYEEAKFKFRQYTSSLKIERQWDKGPSALKKNLTVFRVSNGTCRSGDLRQSCITP